MESPRKAKPISINTKSPPPPPPPPTPASLKKGPVLDDLSLGIPHLMLWVKEEPFIFGVLGATPTSKIGVNMLRKVALYCGEKTGFYPLLPYEEWGHISKRKLQLPIELSWAFFRAYYLLSKGFDVAKNNQDKDGEDVQLEEIRVKNQDPNEIMRVDTLKFLLFLYIQNLFKLRKSQNPKKNSPGSVGSLFDEVWPVGVEAEGRKTNNVATSGPTSGAICKFCLKKRNKTLPEHTHVAFVEANLEEILDFLELVVAKKKAKETNSAGDTDNHKKEESNRIPVEVVTALSFILGAASVKGNPIDTEFSSLVDCIVAIPEVREAVGYLEEGYNGKSVDKHRFALWVKSNLKVNPWGPSNAPVPQTGTDFRSGIWTRTKSYEGNRVYWNTQVYPKGWYLISTVNSQVLFLDSVKDLSSLKIHRCSDSYLYIPSTFSSILVEKCNNCTLFFGPAAKFVKFSSCSNLRVIGVGRMFILEDVINSSFNILTPCHPIICGRKGKDIVMGPYNTFYPQLERHMDVVGMGVNVQKWNKPLELDAHGLPLTTKSTHGLMKSENFARFIFPFGMEGATFKNPCELPRNYKKRVDSVDAIGLAFKMEIYKAKLSVEKSEQLNAIIQTRFHTWLKKEGHLDHLKGLRSIQKGILVGSTVPILETRKSIREENKRKLERSSSRNGEISGDQGIMRLRLSSSTKDDPFFTSDPSGRPCSADDGGKWMTAAENKIATERIISISELEDEVFEVPAQEQPQDNLLQETNLSLRELPDSIFFLGGSSSEEDEEEDGNKNQTGYDTEPCEEDREGDSSKNGKNANNDAKTMEFMDDGLMWSPIY